jgi:hypothetical protein
MSTNKENKTEINYTRLISIILLIIFYFIATMILLDYSKLLLIFPFFLTLSFMLKLLRTNFWNVISLNFIFWLTTAAGTYFLLFSSEKNFYDMCARNMINDSNYQALAKTSKYNIFFIETNYERNEFSTKQLCAIESAAKTNPNGKISILSIKAQSKLLNFTLIKQYSNLVWLKLNPKELFRDTHLDSWWTSGQVFKSVHKIAHFSDAARLAVLYKYGGFYSDLDTIAVKSFEALMNKSGAGYLYENGASLGNGFLHFTKRHSFVEFLMNEIQLKYNPNIWAANGPVLLKESLKSFCQFDDIYKMLMKKSENSTSKFHKCNDLIIYPKNYFFPYTWYNPDLADLFLKNARIDISRIIDSYSIHFYGKMSTDNYRVGINDFSLYEYLAAHNCPLVYEHVKKNGIKFY